MGETHEGPYPSTTLLVLPAHMKWKEHGEHGPYSDVRANLDLPPEMPLHNVVHDRQPQTSSLSHPLRREHAFLLMPSILAWASPASLINARYFLLWGPLAASSVSAAVYAWL